MLTGIRDLDRIILEYVDKDDYPALLLTNKYISSLFDEVFFRKKLLKEYNFVPKYYPKKYYNIVSSLNMINDLLGKGTKISIICYNSKDVFWNDKPSVINCAYSKIQYSLNRDEISLYIGITYDPVLFTTNMEQTYVSDHIVECVKYKISGISREFRYFSVYNDYYDTFIITLEVTPTSSPSEVTQS